MHQPDTHPLSSRNSSFLKRRNYANVFTVLTETENYDNRIVAVKSVLDKLPYDNYEMLDIITGHLKKLWNEMKS